MREFGFGYCFDLGSTLLLRGRVVRNRLEKPGIGFDLGGNRLVAMSSNWKIGCQSQTPYRQADQADQSSFRESQSKL